MMLDRRDIGSTDNSTFQRSSAGGYTRIEHVLHWPKALVCAVQSASPLSSIVVASLRGQSATFLLSKKVERTSAV